MPGLLVVVRYVRARFFQNPPMLHRHRAEVAAMTKRSKALDEAMRREPEWVTEIKCPHCKCSLFIRPATLKDGRQIIVAVAAGEKDGT